MSNRRNVFNNYSSSPNGLWVNGRDPFNQNSNRSDREKWSTSKGGPVFSKLFRLDRTDPLSFGPKFPEILDEWIAPNDKAAISRFLSDTSANTSGSILYLYERMNAWRCKISFLCNTLWVGENRKIEKGRLQLNLASLSIQHRKK